MTREEAIRLLSGLMFKGKLKEALDMAIKALKQEPKSEWQKDHEILKAYSDGVNEVLDKIRAEIEELKPNNPNFKGYFEQNVALNKILEILDKYKAENEPQESEDNNNDV